MKVNVTIADGLLERADAYADNNYMTRSGLIGLALSSFLNQHEMVNAITRVSLAVCKAAENNEIDDATRKEIEDFQKLALLFSGQMREGLK